MENVTVFTEDFNQVQELLDKFHQFIGPIQAESLRKKEIKKSEQPEFKGPVCKGSYALGTACGTCERCAWERGRKTI